MGDGYLKRLYGCGAIGFGAFLVIEHILTWGEFSFWDLIGHEWLGLLLILGGIIANINFSKANFSKELKRLFKIK